MDKTIYRKRQFMKNPDFISREVAGEIILMPIRRTSDEIDYLYTMNEVGGFIWTCIDGEKYGEDILVAIENEFAVTPEEAETDFVEFIQQLEAIGAVRSN